MKSKLPMFSNLNQSSTVNPLSKAEYSGCDYLNIINFFDRRSTNAASESFNAKIKAFRSQFRGVTDKAFFLSRLSELYA